MLLDPIDLRDIHAGFGTAASLVDRRRAVYSAVVELVSGRGTADITPDLLDSPAARAHLGEVVVDVERYRPEDLVPLSRLAFGGVEFGFGSGRTVVVSDPAARGPLAPAVRYIESELGRHGAGAPGLRLVLNDDPGFADAARTVVDGLEIAVKLCRELAEDLLPHVALFAIIASAGTEQLGSASVREFPGLVIVPQPTSPIEVAEALVHEGAHQKFFDLGVTCAMFADDFHDAPLFRSSWAAPSAPGWPLEQVAAAFHAYTCLATFYDCVRGSDVANRLHDFSLLPNSEERADELGEWVLSKQRFFGPDGRTFLGALAGRRAVAENVAPTRIPDDEAPIVVRDCDGWQLLARMGDGIDFYWLPADEPSGSDEKTSPS